MQRHAWEAYWTHGYPEDELMPLSCMGRRWDQRKRGTLDDSLGGYLLTLVDGADALAVSGEYEDFSKAVKTIISELDFDKDIAVSTFEATIRVLGGLLSLHTIATDTRLKKRLAPHFQSDEIGKQNSTSPKKKQKKTNPQTSKEVDMVAARLLELALELGERLLPAFQTPTGIPTHRVNLQKGSVKGESRETCAAAAGTSTLEFGRLSRLTGDDRFERAARRAVDALWSRRSKRHLVGSNINTHTGAWTQQATGIGAGVDSFYEYLLKSAIYFDDDSLKKTAQLAIDAVNNETTFRHHGTGLEWNAQVDLFSGNIHSLRVSALAAFWPSLLVMDGQIHRAKSAFAAFWALWRKYRALPDLYDLPGNRPVQFARDSPLRPELAESALHLYLATNDPHYLVVGREIVYALNNVSKVKCGFAAIADVESKPTQLDDRMDSYFFSETLKYLFLLMDLSLDPKDRTSFFCAEPRHCAKYDGLDESPSEPSATLEPQTDFEDFDPDVVLKKKHRHKKDVWEKNPPHPGRRKSNDTEECLVDDRPQTQDRRHVPAACDPARCVPMEEIIITTEGHLFDMRHRSLEGTAFGPFASRFPGIDFQDFSTT